MRRFGTAIGFALFALFSGAGAGPAAAASGTYPPTVTGGVPPTSGVPPAIGTTLTAAPNASAPAGDSVAWEVCGTYPLGSTYPGTPTSTSTYTLSATDVGTPVCAVELDTSNTVVGISDGEAPPGLSASGAPVTEGQTITLTQGAWGTVTGTLTDAWTACTSGGTCTPLTPAPGGLSFTAGRSEVGDTISVAETSSGGSGIATTALTGAVAATPPAALSTPTISGTPQVGDRLTASPGSWSNSPTDYAYQWERCTGGQCTPIAGATGPTYVPVSGDVNDLFEVSVAGLIDPGQPYGSAGQAVRSYPVGPAVAPGGGSSGGSGGGLSGGGTPPPAGIATSGPPPPVLPSAPVVQVAPSSPNSAIGRLTASMQWTFRYAPRVTQVISLAVEGPAIGSTIATRCRGGGCPFRLHRIRVRGLKRCRMAGRTHCRAPHAINLAWEFHGRRLHVGAVITVAISRRRDIGRYYRFAVRRRRGPGVSISCLAPGSSRPRRSCTAS